MRDQDSFKGVECLGEILNGVPPKNFMSHFAQKIIYYF